MPEPEPNRTMASLEEEAKMGEQYDQCDEIHTNGADELDEFEFSPNGRENKPQQLTFVGSGDRAGMPKQPDFNDNGDMHRLAHATSNAIEP